MEEYYRKVEKIVESNLSRIKYDDKYTYDILDIDIVEEFKKRTLRLKRIQMKLGKIWQEVIGCYDGWEDLGIGDISGLDLINRKERIIIELKNRTNTDNHSSRHYNYSKLMNYKKNNEGYTCIYAMINDKTQVKTMKGDDKMIEIDNEWLRIMSGYKFLFFIYKDEEIIKRVIDTIRNKIRIMLV